MWYAILLSFGIVLLLFLMTNPAAFHTKINSFAGAIDGVKNFFGQAKAAAAAGGVDFNPPFFLFGTLMVAPIAWTSLQWATYSVEQGGEIKNAHVFRNQLFIIVGSLAVTAGLLVLLAGAMNHGIGDDGIRVASSGYWYANGKALIGGGYVFPKLYGMVLPANLATDQIYRMVLSLASLQLE